MGMMGATAAMPAVTVGRALFILLPVMRFILMSGVFPHYRDQRSSAIAALPPANVAPGLVAGAARNARHVRALV